MSPESDFLAWMNAHYETSIEGIFCRRCGQAVGYLTKHAAMRHGDSIAVLPPSPRATPESVALW